MPVIKFELPLEYREGDEVMMRAHFLGDNVADLKMYVGLRWQDVPFRNLTRRESLFTKVLNCLRKREATGDDGGAVEARYLHGMGRMDDD